MCFSSAEYGDFDFGFQGNLLEQQKPAAWAGQSYNCGAFMSSISKTPATDYTNLVFVANKKAPLCDKMFREIDAVNTHIPLWHSSLTLNMHHTHIFLNAYYLTHVISSLYEFLHFAFTL